jgi:hypothetical protein
MSAAPKARPASPFFCHLMAVQNKRSGYRFPRYAEQNRSDVPGRRRNRQHSDQESKSIERLHVENKGQHEGERNCTSDTRQDPDNEPDDDAEEEEEKGGKSKRLYEAGKKCVKHCAMYFSGGSPEDSLVSARSCLPFWLQAA